MACSAGLVAGPVRLGALSTDGGACGCGLINFEITRSVPQQQQHPQPRPQQTEPEQNPESSQEKKHGKTGLTKKPGKKKEKIHNEPGSEPPELRPFVEQWKSCRISLVKGAKKGCWRDPTEFELFDPETPTVILAKVDREQCPSTDEKKFQMKLTILEEMDVESKTLLLYATHYVVSQSKLFKLFILAPFA